MKKGFTIIELAIVLVIIGLLVTGVLQGADLIETGKQHSLISSVEKLKTAYDNFHIKYNAVPGDMRNGENYFSNVRNGDGDGRIRIGIAEGIYARLMLEKAMLYSFDTPVKDLTMADPKYNALLTAGSFPCKGYEEKCKMIFGLAGTESTPPNLAYRPIKNSLIAFSNRRPVWGVPQEFKFRSAGTFNPVISEAIDLKIDDGLPKSGKVITYRQETNYDNCGSDGDQYINCSGVFPGWINDTQSDYYKAARNALVFMLE